MVYVVVMDPLVLDVMEFHSVDVYKIIAENACFLTILLLTEVINSQM